MRLLVPLLLAAAPALADPGPGCPTAADLGRGVVVTFQNGDTTLMRRQADGTIMVEERYVNGDPTMRFTSVHGIYYLDEVELDASGQVVPGSRLDIVFADPVGSLPVPAAGVTYRGSTVNRFADGTERPESTTVAFTAREPLVLGPCTYEALDAALRYDWGAEGGLSLRYVYLPELGSAVIQSNQFDGGEMNTTVPVSLDRTTK